MKKVVFVTSRMNGGGAQKVFLNLINYLCLTSKFDVYLILFQSKPNDKYLSFLNSSCNLIILNSTSKFGWLKLIRVFNKLTPDFIFSTLNYINISVGLAYKLSNVKSKMILREARTLEMSSKVIHVFQKIFYPKSAFHWAITPVIKNELINYLNIPSNKVILAPNPLNNTSAIVDFQQPDVSNIKLLYVGRLMKSKNLPCLFTALSRVVSTNWSLIIVGDGEERANLERLVNKLSITSRVEFLGAVDDPGYIMKKSDIFCFPSLSEGFPNVVTEAMSNSNLCIVNNAFGGGVEFIKEIANSIIIADYSNPDEIAKLIDHYLNNVDELRMKKISSYNESVTFQVQHIFEKYFNELLK